MTNILRLAAAAIALAPAALLADDVTTEVEEHVEMKVIVAGEGHEAINWTSSTSGADLAVGESRVIESASGRTVTLSRTEEGMHVDVDGNTIVVPDIGDHAAHIAMAQAGEIDVDIDHDALSDSIAISMAGTHATRAEPPSGVTIMSSEPLDSSVRESIRSVLISAGIDEEVRFIDATEIAKKVHVIKQVETL